MRIFLIFLFFVSLHASEYDQLLLRAQAVMYPKIILLDKGIKDKIKDNTISLSIVYNTEEVKQAKEFKKMIDDKHKSKLGTYKLDVILLNTDKLSASTISTSYYIFDASGNKKRNIISQATDNNRICFSYNYKDFSFNTLIGLLLKEKTYIYLNKSVIKDYSIKFVPIFYKIVKVINE